MLVAGGVETAPMGADFVEDAELQITATVLQSKATFRIVDHRYALADKGPGLRRWHYRKR